MKNHTPAPTLDITDVPTVAAAELALMLRFLAAGRRALLAGHAIGEQNLRHVEAEFCRQVPGDPARKLAIVLRFRCLVEVLATRRLGAIIQMAGQSALVPALEAAARLRLNARWGFNPHRFAWALSAAPILVPVRVTVTSRLRSAAA